MKKNKVSIKHKIRFNFKKVKSPSGLFFYQNYDRINIGGDNMRLILNGDDFVLAVLLMPV